MLSVASVPERFREHYLEEYVPTTASQKNALAAARRFLEHDIGNLVFVGPPGVGKTHLAAALVNARTTELMTDYRAKVAEVEAAHQAGGRDIRVPPHPILPRWLNVTERMVQMRLEFGAPADDRPATYGMVDAGEYAGLLVLDDLGREKVSDWTGEVIYSLVNSRYERLLGTIVTSNLSAADLAASPYWPAISRLAEDGELVRVEGSDYRLGGDRNA